MHALILSTKERLDESNSVIETLGTRLGITVEEISEWNRKLQEVIADDDAVSRYSKTDSVKRSQLRRTLEELHQERDKIDALLTEKKETVQQLQAEVDYTFKLLKEKSRKKKEVSDDIQAKLSEIQQADMEIQNLSEEYSEASRRSRAKLDEVHALRAELEAARKEEVKHSKQLETANKQIVAAKSKLRETEDELESMLTQLRFDKAVLASKQSEVTKTQSRLDSMIGDVEKSKSQLMETSKKLAMETQRSDSILAGKESKEAEAVEAKKVVDDLFVLVSQCESELHMMKNELMTETSLVENLKMEDKSIRSMISGTSEALKRATDRIRKISETEETVRERKMCLELEIEKTNYKLSSLVGHVATKDEKDHLTKQLRELESQLREVRKVQASLTNEVRRQEVEIKAKEKTLEIIHSDLRLVGEDQKELETEVDAIERELKTLSDELSRRLVVRDELTAQLSSKRKELESVISVFVEKKNMQLSHEDKLRADKFAEANEIEKLQLVNKELHEKRHVLAMRVGDIKNRISQLEISYDHLSKQRLGGNEASAIVRSAQERQSLLDSADSLARELESQKEEIEALETALGCMRRQKKTNNSNTWVYELENMKRDFERQLGECRDSESEIRLKIQFVSKNVETLKQILLNL